MNNCNSQKWSLIIASVLLFCVNLNSYATDDREQKFYKDSLISLREKGKLDEALQLTEKNVAEVTKEFGATSIRMVIPLIDRGKIRLERQEFGKSAEDFNQSLKIMKNSTGWLYPDYAVALNYLISCSLRLGHFQSVKPLIEEVELIFEKTIGTDNINYSHTLFNKALFETLAGNYLDAEIHYFEAIEIAKNKTDLRTYFREFSIYEVYLADLYIQQYRNTEAIHILEFLYDNYKNQQLNNSSDATRILLLLGDANRKIEHFPEALFYYNQYESQVTKLLGEAHSAHAVGITRIAKVYVQQSKLNLAKSLLVKAESIYKKDETEKIRRLLVLLDLADVYIHLGNYAIANQHLELAKELGSSSSLPLYNIPLTSARLNILYGRFIEAELQLSELLNIMERSHMERSEYFAKATEMSVHLNIMLGRVDRAEEVLNREMTLLNTIQLEESVSYFKGLITKGRIIPKKYDDRSVVNSSLIKQKEIKSESYLKGLVTKGRILPVKTKTENPGSVFKSDTTLIYINELLSRAKILEAKKNYALASELLTNVEDMVIHKFSEKHHVLIEIYQLQGENLVGLGNKKEALDYLNKALKVCNILNINNDKILYLSIQKAIAEIYLSDNELEKASALYEQINYKSLENKLIKTDFEGDIAYLYALQGKWKEAEEKIINATEERLEFYRETLNYSSEDEKRLYLQKTKTLFDHFYAMIYMKGTESSGEMLSHCYNLQLEYRDFFLTEGQKRKQQLLAFKKERLDQGYPSYLNKMYSLKSNIATLNYMSTKERKEIGVNYYNVMDRINNLEKVLVYAADEYEVAAEETINWEQIQKKLGENQVAIEIIKLKGFQTKESKYIALVIDNKCTIPTIVDIGETKFLETEAYFQYSKQTTPYSRSLVMKSTKGIADPYETFWSPIQNVIAENQKEVFICADGVFNLINLNILKNRETGKFLIEEMDIKMMTSTGELLLETQQTSDEKNALLVGNPVFNDNKFGSRSENTRTVVDAAEDDALEFMLDPLPGTEVEVIESSRLLKENGWEVEALMQEKATELYLKKMKKSPKVLHIATHGFFINELPNSISDNELLRSGLFFSEISKRNQRDAKEIYSSEVDGILTAYEAKEVNLDNTELLVLSACQSGLAEVTDGEGISGLQYAFRIAGAETIIMSLWSVDDFATQKLMTTFYKKWFETGDKYQAFKEAQLVLMNEYKKPYYWGAFVMVN
ncbi:CHAT domain-containing protein [Flammeovirga kamogawensis]|uniref:CHAT domain-containing protein n=1 Tax=Flammeovirga kamogawensis TaxID=373891 RepID=A0ABX8GV65_9BACT|nr:CHAT domain-containing tetratricopeptide repeat protein [Flammeovirga kamogawensis]MBB6459628.1 CHAT domain-containing protein [Flammeovirga kamogawensis]QWG07309.1 CHAT domain-containing protein [Flammeovirga kamogawensis]TRX69126.1 CHAT domain-containing protein [Flammeovirga kamogawensis]